MAAAANGAAPETVDPVVTVGGRVALGAPAGAGGRPADQVLAELTAAARRPGAADAAP